MFLYTVLYHSWEWSGDHPSGDLPQISYTHWLSLVHLVIFQHIHRTLVVLFNLVFKIHLLVLRAYSSLFSLGSLQMVLKDSYSVAGIKLESAMEKTMPYSLYCLSSLQWNILISCGLSQSNARYDFYLHFAGKKISIFTSVFYADLTFWGWIIHSAWKYHDSCMFNILLDQSAFVKGWVFLFPPLHQSSISGENVRLCFLSKDSQAPEKS